LIAQAKNGPKNTLNTGTMSHHTEFGLTTLDFGEQHSRAERRVLRKEIATAISKPIMPSTATIKIVFPGCLITSMNNQIREKSKSIRNASEIRTATTFLIFLDRHEG
jgi:hypothetical protein